MKNHADYQDLKVNGQTYDIDLEGVILKNCIFKSCIFDSISIIDSELLSCKFENCSFIGCKLSNVVMHSLKFKNCRLAGFNWYGAATGMETQNSVVLRMDNSFDSCKLGNSSFSNFDLRQSAFKDCSLQESSFIGSDLSKMNFDNCDFKDARFGNTNLTEADLSSSYNYVINPLDNRIKGLQISHQAAMDMVSSLGVAVN